MSSPIYITEHDATCLRHLLDAGRALKEADTDSRQRLQEELDRADVVAEADLPPDVVTMNSTVELEDLSDGEILTYTLVYPEQANTASGRISILAPLGIAMLGYRVGDEFEYRVPSGTLRVRIRRLLDPPAATPQHPVLNAAEFRR